MFNFLFEEVIMCPPARLCRIKIMLLQKVKTKLQITSETYMDLYGISFRVGIHAIQISNHNIPRCSYINKIISIK